jgi:hypothetical protein
MFPAAGWAGVIERLTCGCGINIGGFRPDCRLSIGWVMSLRDVDSAREFAGAHGVEGPQKGRVSA